MTDVTQILSQIKQGDPNAADQLLPLVYDELRKLAAAKLANEKPGNTLQPTVLVHEAYLRLVGTDQQQPWNGRGHFFGAAAEAMRRIIIENVRRNRSLKRAGVIEHAEVDAIPLSATSEKLDLLALDEALTAFEAQWPQQAMVVKLRYFAGLNQPAGRRGHRGFPRYGGTLLGVRPYLAGDANGKRQLIGQFS